MSDPETPGADDMDLPDNWIDHVLDRCDNDQSLDVLSELRKHAKNPELLDDIERRRTELFETMASALSTKRSFLATEETGAAINDYHRNVAVPLFKRLVDEMLGIQAELAIRRAEHRQ